MPGEDRRRTGAFSRALSVLLLFGAAALAEDEPAKPIELAPDAIAAAIGKLTAPQRIGQLILVTAEGRTAPSTADFAYLEQCPPGGVIVQRSSNPAAAAAYTARLRPLELRTGLPIWLAADLYGLAYQEPGRSSAFLQPPSLLAVGASHDAAAARDAARIVGSYMRGMGFDLHLGPALVLAPTLPGATGSLRCLGSDPAFTGEAGATMVSVLREHGVLAAPMGFPGGGMNRKGGSAAVLLTPAALLDGQDLLPYRRAIEGGASIIHVGDTLVPTVDPLGLPACLSAKVMCGLLRDRLGFQGVILAGPMDSREVTSIADPAEAAVQALAAGADMVYFAQSGAILLKAVMRISDAVQAGRLSLEALDGSLRRVLDVKLAHRLAPPAPAAERDIEKLLSRRDFTDLCYAVEQRSITLIKNEGGVLPLQKEASGPLLVTGVAGVDELFALLEKRVKPMSQQRITTALRLGNVEDFEIKRITDRNEGVRTIVCVVTDTVRTEGQGQLVDALRATGARVAVVLLGYPHALARFAKADAIVLAYCAPGNLALSMRAVANLLLGELPVAVQVPGAPLRLRADEPHPFDAGAWLRCPAARLPVTVSDAFPVGAGVSFNTAALVKRAVWDFGNGDRAKGTSVSFAYDAPGEYAVTLTVTDTHKNEAAASFPVTVE